MRGHSVAGTSYRSHAAPSGSHASHYQPRAPNGVDMASTRPPLTASTGRSARYNTAGTRVTAFRDGMAVHGRYRQPSPICAAPIQRIVCAEDEVDYSRARSASN